MILEINFPKIPEDASEDLKAYMLQIEHIIRTLIISTADINHLYPRTLTQANEPSPGTGLAELDNGEFCIWIDSDDSKCYACYNQDGTVKTIELT